MAFDKPATNLFAAGEHSPRGGILRRLLDCRIAFCLVVGTGHRVHRHHSSSCLVRHVASSGSSRSVVVSTSLTSRLVATTARDSRVPAGTRPQATIFFR